MTPKNPKTLVFLLAVGLALVAAPATAADLETPSTQRPCSEPVDATCDVDDNRCNVYVLLATGPFDYLCL